MGEQNATGGGEPRDNRDAMTAEIRARLDVLFPRWKWAAMTVDPGAAGADMPKETIIILPVAAK
jgi:hypothetical protein